MTTTSKEQRVLAIMARDSVGVEFTTQQLADRALGDPYRAGELRDVIMPALERAGKVRTLEADDDRNQRRYVLTGVGSYDVDGFLAGYLDGILFTESAGDVGCGDGPDDDTSLLSAGFERSAFTADAVASMRAECAGFIAANLADLERYSELRGDSVRCSPDSFGRTEYSAAECAGTDFWLSRNGHGAGFFDRGDDPVFQRLQDAACVYGETHVYFGGGEISV